MASTRDIRRRIKSVKNTRQITKAMELVAASKMKKAQQVAVSGLPYASLLADVLAALANKVEESSHPFLVEREVKTRGILLITTDKGLCGPLNANLFKLVQEVKTTAKFYSIGRKGTQFLARTKRPVVADFPVHDRVPFLEVKVVADFMIKEYLEGSIDTIEVIYSRFKNTLVQEPTLRPVLPLHNLGGNSSSSSPRPRTPRTRPARTTARSSLSRTRRPCSTRCFPTTWTIRSTSSPSRARPRSTAPAWWP